ncbi:transmembrane protein, putative (macronuclear) [Tetrahymena thermophila SB210]|uniref:Transmembrane protein, putative n=1 Tax=Tetrahymena thermophila (strain SB210) TaxID=312017 RepID=W7X6D1_TETTS|nr:transmembrane protein, putative [Tetrahymena thermophila SB210]EWS74940.1 transmembrane protein, putative [Tetrahymena thermophila SB210]|eukprot:XP_012652529.1 transmembrane protein, putative [Tetrahymena thermophila SB210]
MGDIRASFSYFKIFYILFVRANQINWLLWLINNEFYKLIPWMLFTLIYFLIVSIYSMIAYQGVFNFGVFEFLLVTLLKIFSVEDLYFLIRFKKFKSYYTSYENNGLLLRYTTMLFCLFIQFYAILFTINPYDTSCLYLILPIISFSFLSYMFQLAVTLQELQIYKLISQIKLKNLLTSSFQSLVFSCISNYLQRNAKEIHYLWTAIVLSGYVISFYLIFRYRNRKVVQRLNYLFLFKIIFGINIDLLYLYTKKSVNKLKYYLVDLDKYIQYYFTIASIIMTILYIWYITFNYDNLQKEFIYPWLILLILQNFIYYYLFKKNILITIFKGQYILHIYNEDQLAQSIKDYNNQNLKNTKIIIIDFVRNNSSISIQNCLLHEFEGCQILNVNGNYKRVNKKSYNFQKVNLNNDINLQQLQQQLQNKQVLNQIISIKIDILDDLTYLNMINELRNHNQLIKLTSDKNVFERNLIKDIRKYNYEYHTIYYKVIILQNIVFKKNFDEFLTVNPKYVFTDLSLIE